MFKIKKGDTVKVIAGKDKDKEGKVISVNPKKGAVLVERRKHGHKTHKTIHEQSAGRYRKQRTDRCLQCNGYA